MYYKTINRMFGWINARKTSRVCHINLALDLDEETVAFLLARHMLTPQATYGDGCRLRYGAQDIRDAATTFAMHHGDPRLSDWTGYSKEAARAILSDLRDKLEQGEDIANPPVTRTTA